MIVALAGRRIDAPGAEVRRFPLENSEVVKQQLKSYFYLKRPAGLVCSGACGADLLALEAAGELGIERLMVLPFPRPVFKAMSVSNCPGDWDRRFDSIYQQLQNSNSVVVLHFSTDDKEAFRKTNLELLAYAQQWQHNGEQPQQAVALLVWDGRLKEYGDTTGHFAQEARNRNLSIDELLTIK